MPRLRKRSNLQKQKLDRERKQGEKNKPQPTSDKQCVTDDDEPIIENKKSDKQTSRELVQISLVQPVVFNSVDLHWQLDKCLEINYLYDADLNICANLSSSQPCQIDSPGKCVKVRGDGNCFFRCISYLLCGDQSYYNHIRQVLLLHMCSYSEVLSSLLRPNTSIVQYITQSRMADNNVWATETEIISMAHLLQTDIYTYSSYGNQLKWLKHTAHFVDNSLLVSNKSIYLDHHTGNHFDVVVSVGPNKSVNSDGEKSMLWSEILKQANLTSQNYHRLYKQKKRSDPVLKQRENEKQKAKRAKNRANQNKTRRLQRSDANIKNREYEKRNIQRRLKRLNPDFKRTENEKRNKPRKIKPKNPDFKLTKEDEINSARQIKRKNPDYKLTENLQRNRTRKIKRKNPDYKLTENQERNRTRQIKRKTPDYKLTENQERNRTRQIKRKNPDYKFTENQERNKTRQVKRKNQDYKLAENYERNRTRQIKRKNPDFKLAENHNRNRTRQLKRKDPKENRAENRQRNKTRKRKSDNKDLSLKGQINIFSSLLKRGDDFVCTCCHQTFYQHSVYAIVRQHLLNKGISNEFLLGVLTGYTSVSGVEWVCKTCYRYITVEQIPPLSVANGFGLPNLPNYLSSISPTETEERCSALRIPFMQLKQLGVGKQIGIYGNTVNVPIDPSQVVSSLPRRFENTETIHLLFKRRTRYKSAVYHETVRPKVIYDLTKHLIENSELYKEEGVQLNEEWFQDQQHSEITFASEEDLIQLQNADDDPTEEEEDTWDEMNEQEQAGAGNKDTLFQNTDFTDDGVHALQIAPGENKHPISLFMDTFAEEKSFPVLFAGQKRCQEEDRSVPVKYSAICKAELRNVDGRFAKSVPNIFFKLKKLQALQVKDMATTALRKSRNPSLTAGDLKSLTQIETVLKHDDGFRFLKTLRSSPSYYQTKQKELFAMINQLGLPTFFATFSAAETKWTDLLDLLCKKDGLNISKDDIAELSWMEKCDLIKKNPTACARHFHYRTQLFLNNILKSRVSPIGQLKDYFIRVEFQQRGSPHLHCLFWVKDAPMYGIDTDKKVIEFIDKNISTSSDVDEEDTQFVQLQVHRHSKSCKKKGKKLCRFGFPLPPMKETKILEPFDSNTSEETLKASKQNYEKLTSVLKTLPKDEDVDFKQFLQKCDLTYEQYLRAIQSSLKKKQVFLKRSVKDIRVNGYNLQVLKVWQANTDLQYVLDPWAVCVYIASYIMKSQRGMSQLLQAAAEEAKRGNLKLRDKVRLIANKFLNHCEISAQEAVYLLLQLPLTQSSRDVIFINTSPPEKRVELLKPISQIQQLPNNSTDVTCSGMIDKYTQRPEILENICLAEFASMFERKPPKKPHTTKEIEIGIDEIDNNVENVTPGIEFKLADGYRLVRRTTPKVIRYVKFNLKKDPELHFREQLMLFRPFRDELTLRGSSHTYEEEYIKCHEQLAQVRQSFQSAAEGMEEAMKAVAEERVQEELDEVAPAARQSEEDARMAKEDQSSMLQPPIDRLAEYDVGLDIGGSLDRQEVTIPNRLTDEEYLRLALTMNKDQRHFFYEILKRTKTESEPYCAFLSGGAGVGKSHVLKLVYQALARYFDKIPGENPDNMKVIIAAPTGKAAYNVRGNTLHSLLNIPPIKSLANYVPCDHSTLNTLRCQFHKLKILIIDEVSMVGVNMFNFVCSRLQQIFDSSKPFGGVSLILVGDMFQLRPVGDSWIFQNDGQQYGPLMQNLWQDKVQMYELTTVMRQKDDAQFAHCLNRIRECKHTQSDVDLITSKVSKNEELSDYLHLYSTNADVNDYNNHILSNKTGFKFISVAADYPQGHVASGGVKTLLEQAKSLQPKKTQNLLYNLILKESGNYMITHNINTSDGLTNGATCKIMTVQCVNNNNPTVVWVLFPEEDIGTVTRQENRHLYLATADIKKSWTPILKTQREFQVGNNNKVRIVRKQFPLTPAEAITIHKSQGSTMDKAAISFKGKIQKHMVYVALSRLQTLEGLRLLDFDPKKISVDPLVQQEIARLRTKGLLPCDKGIASESSISIVCHNARSLHKHIDHYRVDDRISNIDVLIVQETWAKHNDETDHYKLDGFQRPICVFTDNKGHRPHSGTFIYVRTGVQIVSSQQKYNSTIEGASVVVSKNSLLFEILAIYCHPPGDTEKIIKIANILKTGEITSVFLGDYNIDHLDPLKCTKLVENMYKQYTSKPLIDTETTDYHSALDQIYTTDPGARGGTLESYWSDHKIVWIAI